MSGHSKKVFIALSSFSKSFETKCLSFNTEPCMIRPLVINLNHTELKYYPFMISADKCSRHCTSVNHLSIRICVPSKARDVNIKLFDVIRNINEAKTMV